MDYDFDDNADDSDLEGADLRAFFCLPADAETGLIDISIW